MDKHLYLIKTKQGQLFDKQGLRMAVTYFDVPKTVVLKILEKKDGYQTVMVGIKTKPLTKCKKPMRKLLQKVGLQTGFYFLKELKVADDILLKVGEDLPFDKMLSVGEMISIFTSAGRMEADTTDEHGASLMISFIFHRP